MKRLTNAVILLLGLSIAIMTSCTKDPNNGGNNGSGNNGNSYNGHEYVDLGLPSGTLWATCNVGATTPEGYGDYFAWGETTPKSVYNWDTYQYSNGGYTYIDEFRPYFTKYCNKSEYGYNGYTDTLTILQAGDDAATANWGTGWRMPTINQYVEMSNNTRKTWTTQNGVNGLLYTASNGQSLFFPAAGTANSSYGSTGHYWLSTLRFPREAEAIDFYIDDYGILGLSRYRGCPVRPVRSTN